MIQLYSTLIHRFLLDLLLHQLEAGGLERTEKDTTPEELARDREGSLTQVKAGEGRRGAATPNAVIEVPHSFVHCFSVFTDDDVLFNH